MDKFSTIANCWMELLFQKLDNDSYFAHVCLDIEPETLSQHIRKMMNYACSLIEEHDLDPVINDLVIDVMGECSMSSHKQLKELFVLALIFHDVGKVNPNFQVIRMQNSIFSKKAIDALIPSYGHSYLGSWLFLTFCIDKIQKEKILPEEERKQLVVYVFFFSYIIKQHHSGNLNCAGEESFICSFAGNYDYFKEYLNVWGFEVDKDFVEFVFSKIIYLYDEIKDKKGVDFSMFALLKLNSSILTAADYLATHEYMSGEQTTDFGILNNRDRIEEIIVHLRNYKYNRKVYAELDDFTFFQPIEKSGDNLNRLRTEMAVELIQTIRKNPEQRLFYIEAPTGGGKTNLSMIALVELLEICPNIQKVFYVFPFTTLITQTYATLKLTLGLTPFELAELHSKAPLHEKKEKDKDGLYNDEKKDYIDYLFALYPITVLSHVKFFDILKSNQKDSNYLFHRLANSIVVIDEIQTYNPVLWDKMFYMISQYARFFNIRFVLMSATLPKIGDLKIPISKELKCIDLLPRATTYLKNPNFAQRVEFRFDLFRQDIDTAYLATYVLEKSKEFAKTKSIFGTVHTIIEFIYKKSASSFGDAIKQIPSFFDDVLVLSGTILESRRKEVINYLKNPENRNKNILLITTQVVEAGVDIDMDLGFKNVSLIDSDEQLAGRVNRNALKVGCEVYLFWLDEARILYGKDQRYKVTREGIDRKVYERILKEKDFAYLYQLVIERIDNLNEQHQIRNLQTEFLNPIKRLDYTEVDRQFRIIDQKNASVFVPLFLPVEIPSAKESTKENVFTNSELEFLKQWGVQPEGGMLDGRKVWDLYERLVSFPKRQKFDINQQINFRILQRVMSYYTFSLMMGAREYQEIRCSLGEEKLGYFYFSHWNNEGTYGTSYDYLMGLNNKAFNDIAFI